MKFKRIKTNTLQLYSMCTIPLALLFVFNYLPMFGMFIAFKDYRYDLGIFGSEFVGFKNFEYFVMSDDFFRITRNTIFLNGLFIFFGLIAAVAVALLLYEVSNKTLTKIYQTVLIIPHFLSWVVVGYVAFAFLNPQYGFINGLLENAGLPMVDWYGKPEVWPFILTLASIWKNVGLNCVIYYAALMGIDTEYFEAAKIDGASKLETIRYITLPFLKPLMIILTILAIGGIFRADFGLFYQLTRDAGRLYATTDVIDTYVYRVMRTIGDMSMSAAVGVMQSIVGFVMILLTNYIVRKIEPEHSLF